MNLTEMFRASTRPAWTARLVVYLAVIVTLSIGVQLLAWFLW